MKFSDMLEIGLSNLWRTKLRTALTTLGVIIGIGALTSMISFGTGMEKNITETFKENDLFTSLHVTPREIDLDRIMEGDMGELASGIKTESMPLTDSVLKEIRKIQGVEVAYPDISFKGKIKVLEKERELTIAAVPYDLHEYPPFDNIKYGSFFQHDSSKTVLVRWEALKRMNIIVEDLENPVQLNWNEEDQDFLVIPPDSLIGKTIRIITLVMDYKGLIFSPNRLLDGNGQLPFREKTTEFVVGGIIKRESQFGSSEMIRGDVFIPFQTAESIPRLGFTSIWDAIGGEKIKDSYSSIYVRVAGISDMDPVISKLKDKMGLNVFAISDQLKEIRRGFLIIDGILGAIGTIALIVAGLGIVNTMLMSILERTREIGIMKAIGGSEKQIRFIFFTEAGTIGLVGAVLGLLLGKVVTILANQIANSQFLPAGEPPVDFFYFPLWLILGAICFSVLLSLLAGLYPAYRASNIDPVRALRHD